MNEESKLSQRADELRQETRALTTMLSKYASKAEVESQLAAERAKTKELVRQKGRWRTVALAGLVLVVAALALGLWNQKAQTDSIIAARKDSRAGLCAAIDDMRVKHNHFVQTTINERQAVIDASTDPRTTPFFEQQIANYRTDLLDVIDCNDPAELAVLFTKPGG